MHADPGTMAVRVTGAGALTLIFVHGGGCDRTDWDTQVAALKTHFRTVTFDLPGHGQAPAPPEPGIARLAEAVADVAARHGGGADVIVAHGMGCRIAMQAVRRDPRRVAGVVLIDPSLLVLSDPAPALERFRARISAIGMDAFVAGAFQGMFVEASDLALRSRIVERARDWDPELARTLILDAIRWDAAEAGPALAALRVPLLIVQSSCMVDFQPRSIQPGMTTPFIELARREAAALQVRLIHGVGHFAQIEAADEVNREIAAFAARLCN